VVVQCMMCGSGTKSFLSQPRARYHIVRRSWSLVASGGESRFVRWRCREGGEGTIAGLGLGDLASGRSVQISLVEMPGNFAACALCIGTSCGAAPTSARLQTTTCICDSAGIARCWLCVCVVREVRA